MKKDYFHCLEQICFSGGINFIQQEAGESVLFINNVATLLRWRSGVAPPEFYDAPACFFCQIITEMERRSSNAGS